MGTYNKKLTNTSYRKKTKAKTRPKSAPAKISKAMAKAVTSIVQKETHKDQETKVAYHQQNLLTYNNAIDTTTDIRYVLPAVGMGIDSNERIGDELRAQKLRIQGHLLMTVQGVINYCRVGVRLMIVQPKAYNDQISIFNNYNVWMPALLKKGAVASAFDGSISSLYAPINRDTMTCWHDELIIMTVPQMVTAVGQQETAQSVKFIDFNINLRNKKFKYSTAFNSDLYPINGYSPMILLGYAFLDGTGPGAATNLISMAYTSSLYYEDS